MMTAISDYKAERFPWGDRKLAEMILFISKLSSDDPNFGATKLNKLLMSADFGYYRLTGSPITGATYQHLPEGPAPKQLRPVRRALERHGDLRVEKIRLDDAGEYVLQKSVALREPDTSVFTQEELRFVEQLIASYWTWTGHEMSEESHKLPAWRLTDMNETIPYEAALLDRTDRPEDRKPSSPSLIRRIDSMADGLLIEAKSSARRSSASRT